MFYKISGFKFNLSTLMLCITIVLSTYCVEISSATDLHMACKLGWEEMVFKLLEEDKALLNDQDEYGDTPLMYAIYVGNDTIVNHLLDHKVDIMIKDNHHLRQRKDLFQILQELMCAKNPRSVDILKIICTCIGNEWALKGTVRIGSEQERNLEGASRSYMKKKLVDDILDYLASHSSIFLNPNDLKKIQRSIKNSSIYVNSMAAPMAFTDFQAGNIISMATGWYNHAIDVTVFKDSQGNQYLVHTDRDREGSNSMMIYQMTIPLTKEILKKIMIDSVKDSQMYKEERIDYFDDQDYGMHAELGLVQIYEIAKSKQKAGNCTWANAKGGFHATLLLTLMESWMLKHPDISPQEALAQIEKQATSIYKDWELNFRASELEKFLVLENAILLGDLPMDLRDYANMMMQMSCKVAVQSKYDKYADSMYPDSTRAAIKKMENILIHHIKHSAMPLENFIHYIESSVDSQKSELYSTFLAKRYKVGSFILIGESSKKMTLFYKKEDALVEQHTFDLNDQKTPKIFAALCEKFPDLKYPILATKK